MARTTTNEYRPITTLETSADDGLSVRAARDIGWGLNNYHYHAGNHPICSQMFYPYVASLDNVTDNLILYLGRWYIPPGQRQVRWWIQGRKTAGTGTTAWTLCSSPDFYAGPEVFTSSLLSAYVSSSSDITSDSWEIINNTMLLGRADFNGYRWFYLLAENDSEDEDISTRSEIVSLSIQPLVT